MKKILQGTDGIRGYIEEQKTTNEPVKIFEKHNILTVEFCELYSYTFCKYLVKQNLAKNGDYIMIANDSRDKTFRYTQAIIDGVLKANMRIRFLGTVPTPAVTFYLVRRGRSGAIMLTASHNPDSQNGIKLFLPPTAIKLLPKQEIELTEMLYNFKYPLKEKIKSNKIKNLNNKVIRKFTKHILKQTKKRNFDNIILMVDCANGSVTESVKNIFKYFKFSKIEFLNTEGRINHNCGVAELEGIREILLEDIEEGVSFAENKFIRAMFKEAKNNQEIQNGNLFLSGFVFDGDGDRFLRAEYDCYAKKIHLLTGDQLAIYFLKDLQEKKDSITFYNTLESDLQIKIYAEEQKWEHKTTLIGDKWLLKKALEKPKKVDLCYENSGHFIFNTKITVRRGKDLPKLNILNRKRFFFTGNGILAGLKSLISISNTCGKKPTKKFYELLENQYPKGILQNLAIYCVNKELLENQDFIKKLDQFVTNKFKNLSKNGYKMEKKLYPEALDHHYWEIKKQGIIQTAIFVRNSGTEDKTSLYLRGKQEAEKIFYPIFEELQAFLLVNLKVKNCHNYRFSTKYLTAIHKGEVNKLNKIEIDKSIVRQLQNKEKLIVVKNKVIKLNPAAKLWIKNYQ